MEVSYSGPVKITCEPQSEITIGQADAVPVFDTVYRNLYVKTDAKEW